MSAAPILINGVCDPRFAAVHEEFERNFRERGEVGRSEEHTSELQSP
jgi:hypothetical protein